MIQLTDINGKTHAIHPDAIARLVEPGTSGKWHGVNCYVRTFDGDTIEVRETVSEVMERICSTGGQAVVKNQTPDGFKLVPIEPTEVMKHAGRAAAWSNAVAYNEAASIYRAMLAAAPEVKP